MRDRHKELLALGIIGAGSRLGDRIELLLRRGRGFSAHVSMSRVAASAIALLVLGAAGSLAPRWIAFAQPAARPAFDVASIKTSDPGDQRFRVGFQPGGRFTADANLKMLIGVAYDVRNHQ